MVTDETIDLENSDELELTADDLYSDGYFITFPDGTQLLQRDIEEFESTKGDTYDEIAEGEELTQLAYAIYSNSKLWFKIADRNKIFNPFDLSGTVGIIYPDLTTQINYGT